ncbi:MAG: hypothetical protein ISR45_07020 [Rhodospirillales bacterium]|nr:hypothetical protein [Rhodospirillales bacterium]
MTLVARRGNPPSLKLEEIKLRERLLESEQEHSEEWIIVQNKKWEAIHHYLAAHPFQVSEKLPRFEQWRRVRDHLKKILDEPEMIDWVILQIDVAKNLAAGIHEMRPRKKGPCYDILMEWVIHRERKSKAVVEWTRGEFIPDFPTFKGLKDP